MRSLTNTKGNNMSEATVRKFETSAVKAAKAVEKATADLGKQAALLEALALGLQDLHNGIAEGAETLAGIRADVEMRHSNTTWEMLDALARRGLVNLNQSVDAEGAKIWASITQLGEKVLGGP